MTDVLRWLIALEVVGLAFLPLTVWALRRVPDRGFIFAKILGLLLVTYITWLVGNAAPIVAGPLVPAAVVLLAAVAGWWLWQGETLATLRQAQRVILVEEGIFLLAFVAWTLLRVNVFGSAIQHTEQFMDMALLNASLHSASYPPFDPWMSGHGINYYYFGYLAFATLCKLAGVAPAIGYNLALSTIASLAMAGAYSIAYALTRNLGWSLPAPFFLALIGNWHAALWQLPHAGCAQSPALQFWGGTFWDSTRVIGAGYALTNWACSGVPTNQPTISEYPLFSFVLGDLHPHVMALPFALLAVALGLGVLFGEGRLVLERPARSIGRLLLLAVAVGALFTINSWDFPTYLLTVAACIGVGAYLADDSPHWWRAPAVTAVALAVASVVLFLPFYVHLKGVTHGIGRVSTPSDLYEFLQVSGFFVLASALLVVSLGLLLQPSAAEEEEGQPEPVLAAESGQARTDFSVFLVIGAVVVIAIVALLFHTAVFFLLLALALSAVLVLHRVLNTETPNLADAAALILVAVGCLALLVPEVIYLRDAFDGSTMYRMNTVFKFYYQGWVLLSLAGAYGAYRSWHILRAIFRPAYGWAALTVIALGAAAAAVYTVWMPATAVEFGVPKSLDGSAWIAGSLPGDSAGIQWLRWHVSGSPTILEAPGNDYTDGSIISTFSGLPAVMGWTGHEPQWRGADPEIATRITDANAIYTTTNTRTAQHLLRKYHVRYVIVGEQEQSAKGYSQAGLGKFSSFMRVAYSAPGITIYTW